MSEVAFFFFSFFFENNSNARFVPSLRWLFRDFFASIRDIVGGRSGSYEEVLRQAKDTALREMQDQAALLGANAVVGVDLDYETVGDSGSMLMVTASGTAVRIED